MDLQVVQPASSTEVGSYFVANYPPFSAWRHDEVPAALRALETASSTAPPPLGLYLHIPFCRKRCHFCYFRVYTDKNSNEVDAYLDALAREIELYSSRPRFVGRAFDFVYFGGGTPSFLSNEQLLRLVERINRHWRWDAAREVTFECEPGTLKPGKLEAIKSIGVTRLSLGIEHFDDDILAANGRAHRSREILTAYENARAVGFPQINIDLIAGMVGETDTKWCGAVERALGLLPDSITIYQMEVPHNTTLAREAKAGGAAPPVATWAQKRAWVDHAFTTFEAAGYRVSSGYTLVRDQPAAAGASQFVYRDSLWHGGDMVGTGVASFSHVGGTHFQNEDRWENYLKRLAAGELPLARALPMSPKQRLIRELILQLKLGHIDAGYFRNKFGVEVCNDFSDAISSIVADGFATADGDALTLTRTGLLRVDTLLPRFFEPEFRNVRYT